MKKHRVDISPQAKAMLAEIKDSCSIEVVGLSTVTEMCIQAVYENVKNGGKLNLIFHDSKDDKLDEILALLREFLPEV